MGSTYRLVLLDEFDWGYQNFKKSMITDRPSGDYGKDAFIESVLPYMIVLNCGQTPPERMVQHLKELKILFDSCYCQIDNEPRLTLLISAI